MLSRVNAIACQGRLLIYIRATNYMKSLVNEKLGKIVKKDGRDGILLKIDMKDLSRIRGAGALLHYALKEFGFNSTQAT